MMLASTRPDGAMATAEPPIQVRDARAADKMAQVLADDPNALAELMLCMRDMDGAAALFIRMMADPERTASILVSFSDYDAVPEGTHLGTTAAGIKLLGERPDIREALTRAGGIRRVHLQQDEFL